jgi:hypothetical protein
MFKRAYLWILLLLFAVVPAQGAGSPWWVWLYGGNGRMVQVDHFGSTLQDWYLPGIPGETYSRTISMSSNGRYINYSVTDPAGNTTVKLYDLSTGSDLYSYALPFDSVSNLDYYATFMSFSPANDSVAFGYVQGYDSHTVIVMDIASGATTSITRPGGFVPMVQYNSAGRVQYTEILYATGGAARYECKEWLVATGAVNPCAAYVQFGTDTYALSEEVVLTLADTNFPGTETSEGMGFTENTVKAYSPVTGDLFTLALLPNLSMARFIQDGERIGVVANGATTYAYNILVMERSGTVSATIPVSFTSPISSMAGILNGFVFTVGQEMGPGGTTLMTSETRLTGTPVVEAVWNSGAGADLRIVWTSDIRPVTSPIFAPWGRIPDPAAAAPAVSTPAPGAPVVLSVGISARVSTTEGDQLNIRSGPGRTFTRIATANNGTTVTILEGPIAADGFNWWRIRLPSGVEGWAVDYADGIPTLIP